MNAKIPTPAKAMHANNISSQSVDYRHIHWFLDDNLRHDSIGKPLADLDFRFESKDGIDLLVTSAKPDDGALVRSLFDGWDSTQGAVTVTKPSKEEIQRAIADRKARIEKYERNENEMPLAVILRRLWFPDGKPTSIEWIANNANRRSIGILGVIRKRQLVSTTGEYDDTYLVPIVTKEFASPLDKLVNHILENTNKNRGMKQLSPLDYYYIARELLKADPMLKENFLVHKLNIKRGEAQRAYGLAKLDCDFPELKLHQAFSLPVPTGEGAVWEYGKHRVDVDSLRHADVVRLNQGHEPGSKGDEGKLPDSRAGKMKAVRAYVVKQMTGNKVTGLTVNKVNELLSKSPVHLLQFVSLLIKRNTLPAFCEQIKPQADKLNKLFDKYAEHSEAFKEFLDEELKAEQQE